MSARVYVMQTHDLLVSGRSACKIGVSRNPKQRRNSVQSWLRTGYGPTFCVTLITSYETNNPYFVEAVACNSFADELVMGNEWFAVLPDEACRAIEQAIEREKILARIFNQTEDFLAVHHLAFSDLQSWMWKEDHALAK